MSICLHRSYTSAHPIVSFKILPKYNNKYQIKRPKSPFTKSNLTTHLLNPSINPQSKLQAFESVIINLESSVKNGVSITDPQIFASLLESCFQLRALDYVDKIHRLIPQKLLRKNVGILSKLLRLYAYNGQVEKAHKVFDLMPDRSSSSFPWNSLISGYAEACQYEEALALYFQMVEDGVEPDQYTYPRVLKACGGIGMIQVGEEVHRHVIRYGFGCNTFVLNALVDMYSKCGDIVRARKVFDNIDEKELVSWNSMIVAYAQHDLIGEALSLLQMMITKGCDPDSVTLSAVLSNFSSYKVGAQIHGWILRRGMEWNLSVANALILFYSNHKSLAIVRWLFEWMPEKDVVSWNSIISAHRSDSLAMDYFNRMKDSNISPDSITFVVVLSACVHLGLVKEGERIFSTMEDKYGVSPSTEHHGCMVNLYGKNGMIDEAYEFLVRRIGVEAAGATAWGALLSNCYVYGNSEVGEIAAMKLFEMEPENEHNFELLIKIYDKVGRCGDVEKIRRMMVERGLDSEF